MNNALDIGISRVLNIIPQEILEAAFRDTSEYGLENAIKEEVIHKMIIKDCNIGGGKTIQINLLPEYNEPLENEMFSVYRIPANARENRDIIEVHRIQYNPRNRPSYFASSGMTQAATLYNGDPRVHLTAFDKAQQMMLSSKSNIGGSPSTPHVEILQGNMVRLYPSPETHMDWVLTCRLAYDKDMTNLNSAALEDFATLVLIATKIYCYRKLVIKIDIGYIKFGAELSSIKDIVNPWGGLEDVYTTQLTKFGSANSLDITRIAMLIQYAM